MSDTDHVQAGKADRPGCPISHSASSGPAFRGPASRGPASHEAAACPFAAQAEAFDPFSDGYQQDPPDYVRWSRDRLPIFYNAALGYWVVTRYDDIKAIFRDNITFSPSIALEKITPTGPEANAVLASYDYGMSRTLVNEDEPAHMPRRRLLMPPFTPESLVQHEPMVRRLTQEYVDRFIDDGRADLVDQMFWEVPLTVALHFLGVPEEDMDLLRQYSIAHTVNTWGRPSAAEQVDVAHAVGNFWQLAGKILAKMRETPDAPGWMQYGIRMQQSHPDVVTDSYLHSMMMAGIVAAHETTANATANAVKLLLQHPASWQALCDDPSLIPNAVEECLRHNGSVAAWRRQATRDVTVGGVALPEGAKILMVTASANHDDRHFDHADVFDIRRDNANEQLTFGYGAHQCMGKNLARMEMQIFLEALTRRLPHLRLAQQSFTYVPNTSFRGPEHLWVEWDPALNPERQQPDIRMRTSPVRLGEAKRPAVIRQARVSAVTRLARDIVRIRFEALDGTPLPRWTAGAHVDVLCGDTGLSRQYSLCGDPADSNAYDIGVQMAVDGRGGSQWIHTQVKVGDVLRWRGPRNHFRMDEQAERVILVAGGIGITPISAMARRAREVGLDYVLHYCGRSKHDMAMLDDLQVLHGDRLVKHISDEGGRADVDAWFRVVEPETQVYACGGQRLLDGLERALSQWPQDTLHTEVFHTAASVLDPANEHGFEVELQDSNLTLHVGPGETLLAALRLANVEVQSDCEEGLCGSCEVRVVEGVVDHRDVVLTRTERDTNTRMMACCSRARDRKIVLAL